MIDLATTRSMTATALSRKARLEDGECSALDLFADLACAEWGRGGFAYFRNSARPIPPIAPEGGSKDIEKAYDQDWFEFTRAYEGEVHKWKSLVRFHYALTETGRYQPGMQDEIRDCVASFRGFQYRTDISAEIVDEVRHLLRSHRKQRAGEVAAPENIDMGGIPE